MSGRVLVLGASGKLGAILRACWSFGDAIWHSRKEAREFVAFDPLTEPDALVQAAAGCRAVLCLSGVTIAHAAQSDDGMDINTRLAMAAIRGAAVAGVRRVLLASSAAVYGRASGILDEGIACAPISDYGKAKLAMEVAGLVLGAEAGVQVCCLRIGNVAGADAILGGWREGFTLDRFADGTTPRRSYIGPESLSRAIKALSRAETLAQRINIAMPGAVEMGALLDAAGLHWTPRPAGPEAIPEVALATARLSQHMTLDPEAGTPAGLVAEWNSVKGCMAQD